MRKDDPQINLRIPHELKGRIQQAAKENHRTQTAEIIARLDESFLADAPSQELPSAAKAKEQSAASRQGIVKLLKERTLAGIHQAVLLGHATTRIDFRDLQLEALPAAALEILVQTHSEWLENAGYDIEWDGPDSLWISFDAV
jgi:DUF1009 family protein